MLKRKLNPYNLKWPRLLTDREQRELVYVEMLDMNDNIIDSGKLCDDFDRVEGGQRRVLMQRLEPIDQINLMHRIADYNFLIGELELNRDTTSMLVYEFNKKYKWNNFKIYDIREIDAVDDS